MQPQALVLAISSSAKRSREAAHCSASGQYHQEPTPPFSLVHRALSLGTGSQHRQVLVRGPCQPAPGRNTAEGKCGQKSGESV